MKRFTIIILLACFGALSVMSQNSLDVSVDAQMGYSFLSSEDGTFYQNHVDLTEGFLLENLKVTARSKTHSWFDQFDLKARTGDRLDTGRMVRFDIRKNGAYTFTLKQKLSYDYLQDEQFNFGASDRNIARSSLDAQFRWTSFDNVVLVAGYSLVETNGWSNLAYSGWLDVFPLALDMDTSRETVTAGFDYHRGAFRASLRQSWVTLERNNTPTGVARNTGFSPYAIDLTATRTGDTEVDAPVTSVKLDYGGARWQVSGSWMRQDATLEQDRMDLKSYLFADMGSRTDFLTTWAGESDAPLDRASFQVSVMPWDMVTVSYDADWMSMETTTSQVMDRSMMMYGTGTEPLVTLSESGSTAYRYEHERMNHGLTVDIRPAKGWTISLIARRDDGDILQSKIATGETDMLIDDEYTIDHTELKVRWRFDKGSMAASIFHESIDDPTFRTAGDKRDGYSFSGDYMLTDTLTGTLMVQQDERKNDDPSIQLNNKNSLIDLGFQYAPSKTFSIGFGHTRMELDFSTLMFFAEGHGAAAEGLDGSEFVQEGYYLNTRWVKGKFSGMITAFYMDDNGASFPLSNWNARASFQYRITDSLAALLSARWFDYAEDLEPLREYNLNQVMIGLRWMYR